MSTKYANGEEYFNKIYMLFNLFIAFSLVPFCYLLLQKQSDQLVSLLAEGLIKNGFTIGLLLSVSAMIWMAIKRFRKLLTALDTKSSLRDQLNYYLSISIRKYVSYTLSQILCVAGLYVTNSSIFVLAYIVAIVIQSIKRPTLKLIFEDLNLSKENQDIMVEKKGIV